ncbi:unnamed protein product, partial [Ectocarpus sp. 8 AP-2014]
MDDQVHGSSCTEAFFRGHVERETRLREGDEAGRRASMVEVLRRIRITDRGGDGNGGDGPHAEEEEEVVDSGDDDGMLDLLTEEEKGRFFREVASGRLGKLIVPWVPWWT